MIAPGGIGMKKCGWLALLFLAVAAAVWMVSMPGAGVQTEENRAETPDSLDAAQRDDDRIRADCQVTQTMLFTLCGHSVTRRVQAPERMIGQGFSQAQSYYDLWQIEEFGPGSIAMSREIGLYCPMHRVLTVNEAGEAVLTRNVYGDGMAIEKTYAEKDISAWSERDRENLRLGIAFDTEAEADAFMASH